MDYDYAKFYASHIGHELPDEEEIAKCNSKKSIRDCIKAMKPLAKAKPKSKKPSAKKDKILEEVVKEASNEE